MLNRSLCVVCGLLVSGSALAQAVLGSATEVHGLVTVSSGATLSTAAPGTPILDGSRYVTGSGSSATLRLSNGCVINMSPNQAITVAGQKTCDQLVASIETTRATLAVAQTTGVELGVGAGAGAGAGVIGPLVALGSIAALGISTAGRGNNSSASTPSADGGGGGIPNSPISTQ